MALSLWPVPQNFGRKIVALKGLSDVINRDQTTLLDLRKGGPNIRLIVNLIASILKRAYKKTNKWTIWPDYNFLNVVWLDRPSLVRETLGL
jgi:hypothetical protein